MSGVSMAEVVGAVEAAWALEPGALRRPSDRGQARPRHVAMLLCHELTGRSYGEIARFFGCHDSTAKISVCRMRIACEADPVLRGRVAAIKARLAPPRPPEDVVEAAELAVGQLLTLYRLDPRAAVEGVQLGALRGRVPAELVRAIGVACPLPSPPPPRGQALRPQAGAGRKEREHG